MSQILSINADIKTVYFLRPVGMEGPVKIGCADIPELRLNEFLTWSPFPLEIVATVVGTYNLEQNLHECFADQHSHREWFHASPKLTKLIDDLRAGIPIEMAVDLSARIGNIRGKRRKTYSDSERLLMSYRARLRKLITRANTVNGRWQYRYTIPDEIERLTNTWQRMLTQAGNHTMPGAHILKALERYIANPVFCEVPKEKTAVAKAVSA